MRIVGMKVELREPAMARGLLRCAGGAFLGSTAQTDTYFRAPHGRLLRRQSTGAAPEWLWYTRNGGIGPRTTKVAVYSDRGAQQRFGERALPVWLVAHKEREAWGFDGVRVHLDDVAGLGAFAEIETAISVRGSARRGAGLVLRAYEALSMAFGEPMGAGYASLLEQDRQQGPGSRLLPPGPP